MFMMAGAAAVGSAGTVSASATTKLMTSSEAMAALKEGQAKSQAHTSRRTGSSFQAAPSDKADALDGVARRCSDGAWACRKPARAPGGRITPMGRRSASLPTPSGRLLPVRPAFGSDAGDGEMREFGAGAIWRMEDVSGSGHTTTVIGDEDVRLAIVQLADLEGR